MKIIKIIGLPIFLIALIFASVVIAFIEFLSSHREDKHTFLEMIGWYWKEL